MDYRDGAPRLPKSPVPVLVGALAGWGRIHGGMDSFRHAENHCPACDAGEVREAFGRTLFSLAIIVPGVRRQSTALFSSAVDLIGNTSYF
jgi:hypothetical protein